MRHAKRIALLASLAFGLVAFGAGVAGADAIGSITFESPTYAVGNINGQSGWMKTDGCVQPQAYDVAVASVADFPAASGYGFGLQALRLSDAVTSGCFGDQTFSPGLGSPAGESGLSHFDAGFSLGTALAPEQPGLHMSVSPDNGGGGRMSYLRFEDQVDGVHVFFDDVTDTGPLGTVATFNETDIATLDRATAHTIAFSIDFVAGPANDVVKIFVDGTLKATGTTWEDYYRFDPEATPNLTVPTVQKLLFRESGAATPANLGNGFLVDGVSLSSITLVGPPTSKDQCKKDGWRTFNNPTFKNQGDCVSYVATKGKH